MSVPISDLALAAATSAHAELQRLASHLRNRLTDEQRRRAVRQMLAHSAGLLSRLLIIVRWAQTDALADVTQMLEQVQHQCNLAFENVRYCARRRMPLADSRCDMIWIRACWSSQKPCADRISQTHNYKYAQHSLAHAHVGVQAYPGVVLLQPPLPCCFNVMHGSLGAR
eukprot:425046-Pleurochrysis_carterae.AAC.1